ncbi:MAG: 23S rRNA (adenine(2503)-C(2))-methyltransferase RlmN [Proteobacteria bacterium]|nr:23S rRNA (adenine(2503)-C(2))-methyltransferase RlmN [Pseudomonadota bacterium]MCL2307778.1 23S rRNA (adenine(2503)-C(2))-methyltransferase RlmN [Pseudomonadota bacterium]
MSNPPSRVNLLDFDPAALETFFVNMGEKPFRARQVLPWLHQRFCDDIAQMSDLSKVVRDKLSAVAEIRAPRVLRDTTASDGTRKWLFAVDNASGNETGAENAVEAVFLPEDDRGTLCISTQAGCMMDCAFCSTGQQGFNRNLSVGEIVGQLWVANRTLLAEGMNAPWIDAGRPPITNVVLMGMGEPLANFKNVVAALQLFLSDHAYGLSRRRVTLSTSGVVPMIDALRDACPVALAVSLHAPDDALRDRLMPVNRRHPLTELMAACRRYLDKAPRDFITFEYLLLADVNDAPTHAAALIDLVRDVPCKFNLIPFNPFPGAPYRAPTRDRVLAFQRVLMNAGIVTTIRKTRGDDIDAACGQLAGQVHNRVRYRMSDVPRRAEPREAATLSPVPREHHRFSCYPHTKHSVT